MRGETWQRAITMRRLCFPKQVCHKKLSPVRRNQMELDTQGTWRWPPGGSSPGRPSPLNRSSSWCKGSGSLPGAMLERLPPSQPPPFHLPFSLPQRTVPKCQNVPPGPSQACPCWRGPGGFGGGMTSGVESTHPWREHSGPRTGRLTGPGTDNTVNRAEWQTASQNNEKPAERWLENISHP